MRAPIKSIHTPTISTFGNYIYIHQNSRNWSFWLWRHITHFIGGLNKVIQHLTAFGWVLLGPVQMLCCCLFAHLSKYPSLQRSLTALEPHSVGDRWLFFCLFWNIRSLRRQRFTPLFTSTLLCQCLFPMMIGATFISFIWTSPVV